MSDRIKAPGNSIDEGILLEGFASGAILFAGATNLDVHRPVDQDGAATGLYYDKTNQRLGLGLAAPTGKLHIDQSDATGAEPVLVLDQADVSEELVEVVSAEGAGQAIDETSSLGVLAGLMKWTINGTTRWVPYYATAA